MPTERDASIMFRISNWFVEGEGMPRLALHVHGDTVAFSAADTILDAFKRLAEHALSARPYTMTELDDEVRDIAEPLGLDGYAGDCKCQSDPLNTIVDVSLYRRQESAPADPLVGQSRPG